MRITQCTGTEQPVYDVNGVVESTVKISVVSAALKE
jgi:hypothetical protein